MAQHFETETDRRANAQATEGRRIRAAGYARGVKKGAEDAKAEIDSLMDALGLAVAMAMRSEPGDSRAVSDEAVSLASVAAKCDTPEAWRIIAAAMRAWGETPSESTSAKGD